MASTWRISNGSFKGYTFHVVKPSSTSKSGIMSQEIRTQRRLQVSQKPGVDGAEVEDFGRSPRDLSCEVIFYGNDYVAELEQFEKILNEGTTGILVLPDLSQAVNAKFAGENRRTTTDTSTVLSLSFVEDGANLPTATTALTQQSALAALSSTNPTTAIATLTARANAIKTAAQNASALLTNNPVLTAIKAANNSIVNTTSTINSVLNIPRNLRQTIISVVTETQRNLANLNAATTALLNYGSLIAGVTSAATSAKPVFSATLTALAPVDFAQDLSTTTSTVNGVNEVVTTAVPQATVSSFPDGANQLQTLLANLQDSRQTLETSTSGSTADYTAGSIDLEGAIIDMIALITPPPAIAVVSNTMLSLAEICFNNGLTIDDVNTVYLTNTQLVDILAIPAFTVVNLPTGMLSV